MATPKVWTAANIKMGRLTMDLSEDGARLYAHQAYRFVDPGGAILADLPPRVVERTVLWAQVPQNIKDALVTISAFMQGQALSDEGMNGG